MPAPAAPQPAGRGGPQPDARALLKRLREEVAACRAALAAIDERDFEEIVHDVRKRLKLARTIVRVLTTALGPVSETLKTELRDAGRALSGPRDAAVLADTARALAESMRRQVDRALLGALADRASSLGRAAPDVAEALRHLELASAALGEAELSPTAHLSLRLAAAKVYRRARKGLREARDAPDTEALHEWRKRVKDRLHVARLFADSWPEPDGPRAKKIDRLGELLGLDHDLAILAQTLGEDAGLLRIRRRIARKRAKLQTKALALGKTLFEAKAADVRAAWAVPRQSRTR